MKGQVSIEMIIAVIVALAFFLVLNLFLVQENNLLEIIEKKIELKTECENIAGIVEGMYSSGKYIEWTGFTDKNISFFKQGFIYVSDKNEAAECLVAAKLNDSSATGNIKIFNYDGNTVIGNV